MIRDFPFAGNARIMREGGQPRRTRFNQHVPGRLELLERAVERGWGDRAWLETDSDLDSLRGDERFRTLLERID